MFWVIETANHYFIGQNNEVVVFIQEAKKFANRIEAMNARFALTQKGIAGLTIREFRGI